MTFHENKAFKCTVINRALSSLHGGLLEIALLFNYEKELGFLEVQHFAESHGWEHTVDHCVYCDTPFMAKSVCSKHEKVR